MTEAKLELPIVGMTCANCANTVERTLNKKVPGVISASVNFGTETATVEFDSEAVTPENMAEAVRKAGYKLIIPESSRKIELPIVGMTCANCANTKEVERREM